MSVSLASCTQVDHAGAIIQAREVVVYLRVCPPDGIRKLELQRARGHVQGETLWTAVLTNPTAATGKLALLSTVPGYQIIATGSTGLLDDRSTFWVYVTSTSGRTASLAFKRSDLRSDAIFKDSRTDRYETLQHWLDAMHCR
jgi:hypothetical protein